MKQAIIPVLFTAFTLAGCSQIAKVDPRDQYVGTYATTVSYMHGTSKPITKSTSLTFSKSVTTGGRIGAEIGLPISSNILKTIAARVAVNLASGVIGAVVISTAISFIPGLGNIGASLIMGGVCYALTLASGYVFLKTMIALFTKGLDPTKLNEYDLKNVAKHVAEDSDVEYGEFKGQHITALNLLSVRFASDMQQVAYSERQF